MNQKNQMNKNGERELLAYLWLEEQKRQRKYLVLGGVMSSEWGRLGDNL